MGWNWVDALWWAGVYVFVAFVFAFICALVADSEKGGARKFWNTLGVFWVIWPLAIVGGVLYVIYYVVTRLTRYFWQERNK